MCKVIISQCGTFSHINLSDKRMRCANFLSMFHFQIIPMPRKKNVAADALSRKPRSEVMSKKPQVNVLSIAYHSELDAMKDQYTTDDAFTCIYDQLVEGQRHDHYTLRDGFLMMHVKLCVT